MHYDTIKLSYVSGSNFTIAHITLNRPKVHNALNSIMVGELHTALHDVASGNAVALVIDAMGEKAFLSGADIAELRERDKTDAMRQVNSRLFRDLETMPMPTIAAIQGYALGGGCELALACDIRIAGENAKLGQPEVSLGIIPAAGGTYRLPRLVGPGIARELIFTGRIVNAEEALTIGLVNRVVPHAEVTSSALAMAAQIGKNSPTAVRYAKQALMSTPFMSTEAAMFMESSMQAVLFEDDEKYRRMDVFLARRNKTRTKNENHND